METKIELTEMETATILAMIEESEWAMLPVGLKDTDDHKAADRIWKTQEEIKQKILKSTETAIKTEVMANIKKYEAEARYDNAENPAEILE